MPELRKSPNIMEHMHVHAVTLSTLSPILSYVENAPQSASISPIPMAGTSDGQFSHELSPETFLRKVHISARLMEEFLEVASDNTKKDLETCGILGAYLENDIFYVTTLIIPKQESSSNNCQAIHEEEIFSIQDEQALHPVGWIHTHPSQSCFMSSVDLHTHYSYQIMVPEAFAIVLAPTDTSRVYGIFRLTDPGGMDVLKQCQNQGFHYHEELSDGTPLYTECSYVYTNSNLRFEIVDLR